VNTYMPLYLVEKAGASAAEAGTAVAIIGFVGVVSRVAWGFGSERLRSYSLPLAVLATGAVVGIVMLITAAQFGLWVAFLSASVLGATAMTWNSVGMLAVLTLSGPRHAGRASGVVLFGFYMGFVASPVIFGYLVDRVTSYGWAWLLVASLFGIAALVGARTTSGMGESGPSPVSEFGGAS
jgi:MFS family permease